MIELDFFIIQVSISDDYKKLFFGKYEVRLYDEEGYFMLRKVQRSGEFVDVVKLVIFIIFNYLVSNFLRKRIIVIIIFILLF